MTFPRIAAFVLLLVCSFSHRATAEDGFLSLTSDSDGHVFAQLEQDTTEMLYAYGLTSGAGSNALGLDRGSLGSTHYVRFVRVHNKVLLFEPNVSVAGARKGGQAVQESFASAVLWSFPIVSDSIGVTIDLTPFLMRDAMSVSRRLQRSKEGTFQLDNSRSYIKTNAILNFPLNTEIDVVQTFTGNNTGYALSGVVPSLTDLTLALHHSFFALPDDGFDQRSFDPAAGSWPLTTLHPDVEIGESVYRQSTFRHRLFAQEKYGATKLVYYVDSEIPEPLRSAVVEGVSWWKDAFDAAGFKDAFEVRLLPDSIHPLDIRYNVVQWVHRKERGWSYGTFSSDPRTGEILKGKVSLGSRRVHHDALVFAGLLQPYGPDSTKKQAELERAVLARLRQLAAHEVGHTLGLGHNFAASVVERGSVMDYPHPEIDVLDGDALSLENAYWEGVGEWDKAAITMLYGMPSATMTLEEWRDSIVNSMQQQGIVFVSDADARPAGSSHADAHLWDNGADIVKELQHLYQVRAIAMRTYGASALSPEKPRAYLLESFVPIYFLHRYQLEAVVKHIGGRRYGFSSHTNSDFRFVDGEQQRRALAQVLHCLKPEFLAVPNRVVQLVPPQSPGYTGEADASGYAGYGIDDVGLAKTSADATFALLLHPKRVARVSQQANLEQQLTLTELLQEISEHMQRTNNRPSAISVEVWQSYLNQLMRVSESGQLNTAAVGAIRAALRNNRTLLEKAQKRTGDQQSAFECMLDQLDAYFRDPSAVVSGLPAPQELPQGSPIGQEQCQCGRP